MSRRDPFLSLKKGLEPPLKDMPHPPMPPAERLRVDAIYLSHTRREIPLRCLNEQMIMIHHEAVCITDPLRIVDDIFQNREESITILIVKIDGGLCVTPRSDIIQRTKKLYAERTSHRRSSVPGVTAKNKT